MVTKLAIISGVLWTTSLVLATLSDANVTRLIDLAIQIVAGIVTMATGYFALKLKLNDVKKEVVAVKNDLVVVKKDVVDVKVETGHQTEQIIAHGEAITSVATDVAKIEVSTNSLTSKLLVKTEEAAAATAVLEDREITRVREEAKAEAVQATADNPGAADSITQAGENPNQAGKQMKAK